jgi:hypothetical protein
MAYNGPAAGVINIIPRTSSGSGVYVPVTPSADIGGDGDFAFDQNTNTLYGPKDSTQPNPWPVSGLSIGNGRYTWRAAWSSSNSYNAGDIVHYNAQQFVCIKTLDYGSPVAWTAKEYTAGSYVTYSSVLYVAVVDAVSGDVPGTATAVWKVATPNIDAANYAFAAQGNFLRLSSSIQAETSLSSSSGTMRLAVAQNALLYGAYPIAPQGIETGVTFPNYIVDSQAVDSSSSLELSTTTFTTPAWNSSGGSATVEVKAGGVTTAKIADAAVTNAKLDKTTGSQAVSTGAIRDAAVTTAKLADDSVTSAKIVAGTIATSDIASGAITQPLLGTEAVGDGNISPYLTTATNSPSAYLPATKLVSASTTVSGTSISTTNPVVDATSAMVEKANGSWLYPWHTSTTTFSTATARATRFVALRPLVIKSIAVNVLTASTNSETLQVGIFHGSNGNLLQGSGNATLYTTPGGSTTTTTTSTGIKYIVLNGSTGYTLVPGTVYYIAVAVTFTSGTGVTLACGQTNSNGNQLFGATYGNTEAMNTGSATLANGTFSTSISYTTGVQPTFGLLSV